MPIKREHNAWEKGKDNDYMQQLTNLAKMEKDNCSGFKKYFIEGPANVKMKVQILAHYIYFSLIK